MSPHVSLSKPLRDGIDAQSGADVIANFNDVLAVLNGGIDASNISFTAGIPGNRLSSVSGSQIQNDRLETDCVDSRVLKKDATTGAALAAIQDATYIKDGAITGKKMSASTLGSDKLKINSHTTALGSVTNGGNAYDTGRTTANTIPLCVILSGTVGYYLTVNAAISLRTTDDHWIVSVAPEKQLQSLGAGNYALYNPTINMTGISLVFYYLEIAST